ncbi:hypothetical protein [Borrelia hispanica]|uniref:hypothetical protein n=1 Tax=Borrelia hispanica TaxID=40835 RepID=UPI0006882EA4|nr:hypothetical protein [Borrelia hispanica]
MTKFEKLFYQLLLPYKFSHLLLDRYIETLTHYVTIKDALLKDHNIVTALFKGLDHPILYEPNETVMFVSILSEIDFRRKGDYIHASMLAGIVHLRPEEVVEITVSAS